MTNPGASPALQQLVVLIREATGNVIPPARFGFLDEVAQRRASATGHYSLGDYVRALAAHQIEGEWATLVSLVTIKESYFFRAPQQFDAILKSALPVLLRARAATRHLRIWSAACARGEEPATRAMRLADGPTLAGWTWTIVATDLDDEALAGARLGLYGERAVAQVPPELLARWFTRRGKLFELDAALRSRISYQSLNLAHAPFALPFPECDLVLMRNVLIYFRRPLQRWVVSQVGRLLAPEGYLFLGASETLWQIQDELESLDLGPCFAYRHRQVRPVTEAPPPKRPAPRRAPPPPEPALPAGERARWTDPDPRAWSLARAAEAPAAPAPSASSGVPASPVDSAAGRLLAAARDLAANR